MLADLSVPSVVINHSPIGVDLNTASGVAAVALLVMISEE